MDGRPRTTILPAGPVCSPLARFDQRLNLFAADTVEPGMGRELGLETNDPPVDNGGRGVQEGAAAATAQEAASRTIVDTVATPPALARDTKPNAEGSRGAVENASGAGMSGDKDWVRDERLRPSGDLPSSAPSRPVSMELRSTTVGAQVIPPSRKTDPGPPRQSEQPAWEDPVQAATSAPALQGSGQGSAAMPLQARTSPAAMPSTGNPSFDALTRTLGQISRWMASPPQEARPRTREPTTSDAAGRKQAGPLAEAPVRPRPRVKSSSPAGNKSSYAPSARPSFAPSAPRLSVGRIDVQVVAPSAPPVHAVVQTTRSTSPARASASAPSYLTFGLRQR